MGLDAGFDLTKAWICYGFLSLFLLTGFAILIHNIAARFIRVTTIARLVSTAPGTAESIRNFATLPNMNAWNAERKNVGFPPDIREFVDVQVKRGGKWKFLRLYPSKHTSPEQMKNMGKAGDYVRIVYRGNQLISFSRHEL